MNVKQILLLVAVLCLGLLAGLSLQDTGWLPLPNTRSAAQAESPSARGIPPEASKATLTADTGTGHPERIAAAPETAGGDERYRLMEQQLSELRQRIEALEDEFVERSASPGSDTDEQAATAPAADAAETTSEARLVAAGIDPSTAAWIQQQLDENALEELYLQNRASREGWLKTHRYNQARREIRGRIDEFRAQLGDETYDRLLYALGRSNRVLVNEVMQGSPAQQTGLVSGDTILGYDGKRVFSISELQKQSGGGDPASWVTLEVIRDGETMNLYVPGGPLGIRLSTGRVLPQ